MPDDRDEVFAEKIVRSLRRPVEIGSSFDARVMRAVRAIPPHSRLGAWSRLVMPRTVTVRPLPVATALLAASLLVVAGVGALYRYRDSGRIGNTAGSASLFASGRRGATQAPQRVQFVLVAPSARKVAVVGDFNGWDRSHAAFQAQARGGGVWSVTAQVPAGHHRYSFVVDDSLWMADPTAPRAVDNDYGLPNSAMVIGEQNR